MDLVEQWLPWVLGGLLVGMSILLVVLLRVRGRRADRELAAAHRSHQDELTAARQSHQGELEQVHKTRDQELARERDVFQQEEGRLRAEADRLENDRDEVIEWAASGMRWERASRETILDACLQLGVNGVLATNVVFLPERRSAEDSVFVAQVDHLLVTPATAMVIESKRWRGLVFDGVHPSSAWPPLSAVIDESQLVEPYAMQIRREGDAGLDVLVHSGDRYPAVQVRQQAARLREFLNAEVGGGVPWVETCVFYSHPGAVVHAARVSRTQGGAETHVAAGADQLKAAIETLGSDDVNAEAPWFRDCVALLRSLGADLYGLGRYATEWSSIFPREGEDVTTNSAEATSVRSQGDSEVEEPDAPEPTVILTEPSDVEHTVVMPTVDEAHQDIVPDPFGPGDQPTERMPRS